MTTYELKRGDTAPSPRAQLVDGAGAPVNLTGASVRFKTRVGPGSSIVIDAAAVVEAGTQGWVHYDPVAGNTASAGAWLAEWQVTYAGGAIQTFPGGGDYDLFLVSADLDAPVTTGGTGYCTRAQARAAGAAGTDAEVDAAIATAQLRVDRFTSQSWAPAVDTVVAQVSGKGIALLPRRIDPSLAVAVRYVGATVDVPTTAYLVTSSRVIGQVDAVVLGRGGGDILIAGAEPYNGGWAGLTPRTGQVQVTATFGVEDTPVEVVNATALIAASVSQAGGTSELALTAGPDVDDEGNTVAITAGGPQAEPEPDAPARTTGVPAADVLLRPLVRRKVRLT